MNYGMISGKVIEAKRLDNGVTLFKIFNDDENVNIRAFCYQEIDYEKYIDKEVVVNGSFILVRTRERKNVMRYLAMRIKAVELL